VKRAKPSMRERKRYITFEIISKRTITYNEIKEHTFSHILELIGEKGVSLARPRLIKNLWNDKTQSGVLRVHPEYVNDVKVAQTLIRRIGQKQVIVKTGNVFGTLHKIKKGAS